MSVNKVILIGHVGKEPRVKHFDGGSAVATFSLATTDRAYTLANGTNVPERTEWHNVVATNRLADVIEKYVHKGDKLYLECKLRTRDYDDSKGVKHYITEVFVDYMEMLSVKPQQAPPPQPYPQQSANQNQNVGNECPPPPPPTKDDLPF